MLSAFSSAAERNLRFVKQFRIPGSPEVIVVSEGDFEPRSVGSYTVKVYGGSSKKFPTDDFVTGLVRPRNGTVEDVRFEDVDGDGKPDIVVLIRSAGTGSYLSADAFRYKSRLLEFIGSVSGLEKTADAVQALRHKFKPAAGDRPVPHPESPRQ